MNRTIFSAVFFVVALGLGGAWTFFQWQECAEMGHSTFYCLGHVLR